MSEDKYYDAEGNERTLYQLINLTPEWACSRIHEGEKAIKENKALKESRDELLGWVQKHRQLFPHIIDKWWIRKIDRLIQKAEPLKKEKPNE